MRGLCQARCAYAVQLAVVSGAGLGGTHSLVRVTAGWDFSHVAEILCKHPQLSSCIWKTVLGEEIEEF